MPSSLIILLLTNQSKTKSHFSWVLYLSRQYFSVKGSLEQFYHMVIEFYINKEQNQIQKTKEQISTALTSIFLVLNQSGTNCIVEGQISTIFLYVVSIKAIENKF